MKMFTCKLKRLNNVAVDSCIASEEDTDLQMSVNMFVLLLVKCVRWGGSSCKCEDVCGQLQLPHIQQKEGSWMGEGSC